MRRAVSLLAVATVLVSIMGCAALGRIRTSSASKAATKDCAACEKMCAVAGDAEKNPDAVESCKADCRKSCQ